MSCEVLFEVLENGSIRVEIEAEDQATPPNELLRADLTNPQWQLMRESGYIINDRSFANSSYDDPDKLVFYLKAADLVTFEDEDAESVFRTVDFRAKYDTTESGQPVLNVDIVGTFSFQINRRRGSIQEIILTVGNVTQDQVVDGVDLVLP